MPAGRRPVWIQSRRMRCSSSAVERGGAGRRTASVRKPIVERRRTCREPQRSRGDLVRLLPKSRRAAKRWMYSDGSMMGALRFSGDLQLRRRGGEVRRPLHCSAAVRRARTWMNAAPSTNTFVSVASEKSMRRCGCFSRCQGRAGGALFRRGGHCVTPRDSTRTRQMMYMQAQMTWSVFGRQ